MKFSVRWLEDAPNRAPEERATAADLKIWLGDSNATLHFVEEQPGNSIQLPVYSLAEGLALDWWRLFGSREEEISLKRFRSGYAVPDVRMRFDGAAFDVHVEQATYRNPDVRFWSVPGDTLSYRQAETTLVAFIEKVLDRLRDRQVTDTTLALRWARVRRSLEDPDERGFCEAAAALGEDPYYIDDAATAIIERAAAIFSDELLTEFLAGARGKDENRLLNWIERARQTSDHTSRLDDLRGLALQASQSAPAVDGEVGWARGYRRARACRAALGLGGGDRLRSYKQLARRLGNANFRAETPVDGIRALREDDDRGVRLHLRSPRRGSPAEQLFSLARGVGDVACFPEPGIAPINDLLHAYRQRCSRAFAAEFLAPVHEVQAMAAGGRDRLSVADEFGVSERVIDHQLENALRIERACAA